MTHYDAKKRDFTIDALKAAGIFLVVLGHTTKTGKLFDYIYSFHMPLFFIISGLLYKAHHDIVKRQAKALFIPYLLFAIITFLYWALIERNMRPSHEGDSIVQQFANIFYPMSGGIQNPFAFNVVLWFLPCLFIVIVCYHCLKKLSLKTNIGGGNLFNLLIVILFSILAEIVDYTFPFFITTAFGAIAFYATGNMLIGVKKKFDNASITTRGLLCVVAIIVLMIRWFYNTNNNMMSHSYGTGFSCFYIWAVVVTISIYVVLKWLPKQRLVSYIGENTLIIMCLHEPLKRIVIQLYSIIFNHPTSEIREDVVCTCFISITTITILLPMVWIINKYMPWIKGGKRSLIPAKKVMDES